MKKIKDFFVNASERLVKVAKRFPVTFVVILITTIYMYIQMQFEVFDDDETFGKILITLITFGMGTLFVETFDKKKEMFTYVGYVIALGISVTYYFLFGIENAMEMQRYLLVRLLGVYLTSLGFATIFVLHRKTDLSFKEYAVKVFSNLLKTSIYYGVFCIGTITIFIIFEVLIFSNGFDVYFNLLFLTFGIFYTPLVINCFVDLEEKIAGFLRGLITFVLYPIAIISTALIYVYFIKTIVEGEFLKESVFYIIAWLFVSSFPVMIITNLLKDDSKKLNTIYCAAYVPFIFVEIYSMSLRVSEYGLTSARYMAYIFILMQIVIIALLLYKEGKYLNYSLIVLVVLTVLTTIGPVSFLNLGVKSQERRLAKVLDGVTEVSDLSEEERSNAASIIRYLENWGDEEYVNTLVSKDMKEEITDYYGGYYSETGYKYSYQKLVDLDITNYSRIMDAENRSYGNDEFDNVVITANDNNTSVKVDVSDLLEELLENDDDERTSIILKTSDPKYDFYFSHIHFEYNKKTKEIKLVSVISGYLLERK